MFKSHLWLTLAFLAGAVLAPGCGNTVNSDFGPQSTHVLEEPPVEPSIPRFSFRIVHIYPHDPLAFTQGLIYYNGRLYEGTGQHGRSSLRLVDLETGEVLRIHYLPEQYFGEGITVFDDKIVQLTWQSNVGFVYDLSTFEQLHEFPYSTEGWGITSDGKQLIMSDGSSSLYFWNPQSLLETGRVEVRDQGKPVANLNELEYIKGTVYANVWGSDRIALIDPASGDVTGWIELEGLLAYMDPNRPIDVLNGIAYDSENDRLFVTGKLWPNLFEIELVPVD